MKSEAKKQAESREEAKKQEAKKRKAKERENRRIKVEPCLYCGKPTLSQDYVINPDAQHELPCCSKECFDKTKAFVDFDTNRRKFFYITLFILVVSNLILIGLDIASRWRFLPMLGIGVATIVYPLVFTRYERYQKYGIRKTATIIRIIAAAIAVFALALIIHG